MDYSESFVASIAQALNSAQVPCVLWGHYLLNVHGVPSIIGSIDFVIPDDRLREGIKALTRVRSLEPCLDKAACPSGSQERPTPPPAFHLHIETSEVTAALYLQSETLWFLPPLDSILSSTAQPNLPPYFVLASDTNVLPPWRPGRGSGVFKPGHGPVILPKSHILLEAFLRLYARDSHKRVGAFAIPMICYMWEYVDDDGLLDVDQLPEPLRTSYRDLREGKKQVHQWSKELKEALGVPEVEYEDRRRW